MVGELRQGALEGVVIEAVARAFAAPAAAVRRAVMLAGAVAPVAAALAEAGPAGLGQFELRLFQPVQPMLADTAADVAAALERLGRGRLRIQARRRARADPQGRRPGRGLQPPAQRASPPPCPRWSSACAALPARRLVIDGEAIALSPERRPLPFQVTMRRFGRRLDVERLRQELPLEVVFFDALRIDDDTLIDRPLAERWQALAAGHRAAPTWSRDW